MPSSRPIKVELVTHSGREEALKGIISLLFVGMVLGVQWWSVTPEAERRVRLGKLGVTRCREKKWHFHGVSVQWPPGRCLCSWPLYAASEDQAMADAIEGRSADKQ